MRAPRYTASMLSRRLLTDATVYLLAACSCASGCSYADAPRTAQTVHPLAHLHAFALVLHASRTSLTRGGLRRRLSSSTAPARPGQTQPFSPSLARVMCVGSQFPATDNSSLLCRALVHARCQASTAHQSITAQVCTHDRPQHVHTYCHLVPSPPRSATAAVHLCSRAVLPPPSPHLNSSHAHQPGVNAPPAQLHVTSKYGTPQCEVPTRILRFAWFSHRSLPATQVGQRLEADASMTPVYASAADD